MADPLNRMTDEKMTDNEMTVRRPAPPDRRRDLRPDPRRDSLEEIDSRLLLGSDGRVRIRHGGRTYELRETRFGKLILTR